MIKHTIRLLVVLMALSFLLPASSCRKFEGDQTIPSYIKIDSLRLETDYAVHGSNSHKIVNVWIYVDENLEGIYELPVNAPILVSGTRTLTLEAGVNMNGISSTRIPYPMFAPVSQEVDFRENYVIDINGGNIIGDDTVSYDYTTTYLDNCEFVWIEDFEDPSVSLDSLAFSQTNIYRTDPANNPQAFLSENSRYSGIIELNPTDDYFLVATNVGSDEGFFLPSGNNWPLFLEFNFKNNMVFTVGLYAKNISEVSKNPILNLIPTDEWNKIYVNLKPLVNASTNAIDFNVFFEGWLPSGQSEAAVYLDNIKLIYRKGG